MAAPRNLLGIDLGGRRIGIATASSISRLPSPLITIENNDDTIATIKQIIKDQQIDQVVVGLPIGIGGKDTDQTKLTRVFVAKLRRELSVPVALQDESLSSVRAEELLDLKTRMNDKGKVDSIAATFILDDYLSYKSGKKNG